MKITRMSIRRLSVDATPFYAPFPVPDDEPAIWEYPLLVLSTDDGLDGYSMSYGTNGEGRGCAYLLNDIYRCDILGTDPFHSEAMWHQLRRKNRHLYALSDCLSGVIDVALWDLKGKAAGKSIAKMIGIAREKVPSYASATWSLETPQQVADEAVAKRDAGYHGYKMQWREGPCKDIPKLRAARAAVGDAFPLMHDPNAQYSYEQALEVGRVLDELGFLWFEEPIPDRQTEMIRKLADELATPILATETLMLDETVQVIRSSAADLVRGDVHLKSGITGLRKMIGMCELFGINMEIHTAASPILDVANLQVACTTHLSRFIESHHALFRFGLKNNPLEIDAQGYVHLPAGPGLGIDLDWDWIEDHTIEIIEADGG